VVGDDRSGDVRAAVAVVPFANPSGDPAQEYLARGFVEDLTTELSRFPTLDVLRPSAADEPPATGYLLQGSVRRLGNRVRIAVQLIDGAQRRQIWAERFDASAETLFDIQDEIVAHVAASPRSTCRAASSRRCARWVPEVAVERARAFFERALGQGGYAEAIDLLADVRDRANRFGGSHAQRDALTLTLIEAALRAGRPAVARHYTAERIVHKPASAWGWRLLARAGSPTNGGGHRGAD
jgi:adenylate cyclase